VINQFDDWLKADQSHAAEMMNWQYIQQVVSQTQLSIMREKHFVYVIELDKDVLYESKFKKANPEYETGKPCVYVGMTA
jgi:hypothetical protein